MNRRQFLNRSVAAGVAAAAAPMILPSRLFGSVAPSKQITLGFIGTGGHGKRVNLNNFLQHPNARVLAVCDVKLPHAYEAKLMVDEAHGNNDCVVYQDFRDILARKDIDAIVISTPDHWHVPLSMMGLKAGKHVFSEKPSLTITQGRELVNLVQESGKVFQWGIEDRALQKYWLLAGLARTGALGEVHSVDCCQPHKPMWEHEKPTAVPDDLDWNLWLGPAPYVDYTPQITHPQRWRQCIDYSGGSLTDWGMHLVDTAQVAIGMDYQGPTEILGTSRALPASSYITAPSGYDVLFRYDNNATIRVRDTARKIAIRIEGTKGWVQCEKWNGDVTASDRSLLHMGEKLSTSPDFWKRPNREQKEFIDVIMNGGQTTYNAEAGHRLASTLHLGHMAIRADKSISWNPEKEVFTKDASEHKQSIIYRRDSRNWEKHAS